MIARYPVTRHWISTSSHKVTIRHGRGSLSQRSCARIASGSHAVHSSWMCPCACSIRKKVKEKTIAPVAAARWLRVRRQPDDPVSEHRVAAQGVERQRQQPDAEVMFGVPHGGRRRVEDVGVEQRQAVKDGVGVPRQRPDQQPRVPAVGG
jgi:hypothetical protein